jgi:hypothetical protein
MYKPIEAVKLAIASAVSPDGVVSKDRRRFVPFFEAAEKYAHSHGLLMGGNAATLMLLGDPLGPSDYYYELFSTRALADARALTEIFYNLDPQGLGHYSVMKTRTPQKEFEISVDERPLFLVRALELRRGVRLANVMIPVERPAYFARNSQGEALKVKCVGAEIRLTEIYSSLSDPSKAGEWETLLVVEERMRDIFAKNYKRVLDSAVTGGKPGSARKKNKRHEFASPLIKALMKDYVPRTGHALVGGAASLLLSGGSPGDISGRHRLQLVSSNAFEDESQAVTQIASRLGFKVSSVIGAPGIPTEPMLKKMTMYLQKSSGKREAFLDIFNAGSYQLQGVDKNVVKGIPLGVPFVILRFQLIDLWIILFLMEMEAIPSPYAVRALGRLKKDYDGVVSAYLKYTKVGMFSSIFPREYIGRHSDPIIMAKRERRKRESEKGSRYYPPYYPARKR